jgi:transcriptional regulator with XRE-family HTH domain
MLNKKLLLQFGEKLRDARTSKAVSQEDLALNVGFDRTYISLLERGKRNPSLLAISKIANQLEVQLAELMPAIKIKK